MIKHEPLPWFAFEVASYIKNTMRLSRDAHGAYLLLMLDYYATGEPCPDDDHQLAAVTKSTLAEWQTALRPVLAPFFNVRDGRWHHDRIEKEMLDASTKHAAGIARARAGGEARWAKARGSRAEPKPTEPETPKTSSNDAPSIAGALPEQCLADAHLHKHNTLSLGDADDPEGTKTESAPEPQGIGTSISEEYRPPRDMLETIGAQASPSVIELEIQKFVWHHRERGTFSHDWDGSFGKWWSRFIEHQAKPAQTRKRAPPRVEVDVRSDQLDWDGALTRFKRNNSHWNTKIYGPAPDLAGCRVPREKLIEHGFLQPEETK